MEVQIKKGDPARLEDYMDVMRDSILWERCYAPDESVLRGILTDALARGAVLTAEASAGVSGTARRQEKLPRHGNRQHAARCI